MTAVKIVLFIQAAIFFGCWVYLNVPDDYAPKNEFQSKLKAMFVLANSIKGAACLIVAAASEIAVFFM
jgi:hypothetical protein